MSFTVPAEARLPRGTRLVAALLLAYSGTEPAGRTVRRSRLAGQLEPTTIRHGIGDLRKLGLVTGVTRDLKGEIILVHFDAGKILARLRAEIGTELYEQHWPSNA